MFEKKRNSIIKIIIILLIIVISNLLVKYPSAYAGRWRYQYTTEDIYNVTISSDDAIAVIDNYFSSSEETITLKINIYELIIGLRFDNISIVHNSTHSYAVKNAYLSLYSDHVPLSYESESGQVTIYFERDNDDIQTFSNYTELISREPSYNYRNWDLDDVHGDRLSGRWNDSPNLATLVSDAISFDNDTICFLIYSDRGVWFRYFNTIDCFVDFAPRLHIIYDVYEYEETPPSGYDDAEYVEEYRGFDIWSMTTGEWMNYLDWNEVDALNKIDVINSTYVNLGTQFDANIVANLNNDSQGSYVMGEWKFGLMVSALNDNEAGGRKPILHLHSLGEPHYQSGVRQYSASAVPTEYLVGFGVTDYDDATDGRFYFGIETWYAGFNYMKYTPSYYEVNSSRWYWIHVIYDVSIGNYNVDIYNDREMTNLEVNINRTGYEKIVTSYDYEFAIIGQNDVVTNWDCWMEGALKTTVNILEYIISDEDGNVIGTINEDATIEDVRAWIDNYLGASSEYDKSPWMGDFTLLLVGLVGVAFIPLGFLIFVSSVRDGDIIGGLQTLVIMFFIGIGCIITWLWA